MSAIPIILLLLYFWRLSAEVRQEMRKPPEPAKSPDPVINNTQTNYYHQTVNIIVIPDENSHQ